VSKVELVRVEACHGVKGFLYKLLLEREGADDINISHKNTPTFEEHSRFVDYHPYRSWYIITHNGDMVGSIYLTYPPHGTNSGNEIGVFVQKSSQGMGIGSRAVAKLMNIYGDKIDYYANINVSNYKSQAMFGKLGFDMIQVTLKKSAAS
jgi:RimJ/RimL family protein N-acetyltransferase